MQQVTLEAEVRNTQGKAAAHKLRASGRVPAILYSKGGDNTMLAIEERELTRVLATGEHPLVELEVKGAGKTTAIVSEVQRDTFQKHLLHVDFHRVRMDEVIHTTLQLAFTGQAGGAREGGMVEHMRYDIEVAATPTQLPKQLEVDVTGLAIGDSLHVRDLKLPPGVTAVTDGDEMVALVQAPRTQEATAAEGADTTLGAATPA
jgi:large subunit ribosomal protein L25